MSVECESERAHSFVHVTRDLDSFTRDELAMLTALFAQRFGAALVRNPKTPIPLAVKLVSRLPASELKVIAKSQGRPQIVQAAKKILLSSR